MNNKVRQLLDPSEQFCRDCEEELHSEMRCSRCERSLFNYSGTVYECSVCEKLFCDTCWEEMEEGDRFAGKITTWFAGRNYGFIRSRKIGSEVFVHADDLDIEPRKGKKVSFELERTSRGLRARRVRES